MVLFLTPMFILVIIAPFQPGSMDISHSLGMVSIGLVILAIPVYFLSIISRMKHIHFSEFGFYFKGKIVRWADIEKITIFRGNSARFTIKYFEENKIRKVFGSLFLFNRGRIIKTLKEIAREKNISISNWWI